MKSRRIFDAFPDEGQYDVIREMAEEHEEDMIELEARLERRIAALESRIAELERIRIEMIRGDS